MKKKLKQVFEYVFQWVKDGPHSKMLKIYIIKKDGKNENKNS